MTSTIKTILVIGGTSGIGEAFARRFHSLGKKVIITGRRSSRLAEIQKSLPGLETYQMDNNQLKDIPQHIETLFSRYEIDTVWVNSGIMGQSDIKDPSSTTDEAVIEEVTVNSIAPMIFARHTIPRLLARAPVETQFMVTSSGLGFTIIGKMYPVYCSTKAGIHSYMYGLRQALKETNVNVIEIVPPKVATDLDADHKIKGDPGLTIKECEDEMFAQLESTPAKAIKELPAGNGHKRVKAWRDGSGKLMEEWGLED